MENKKYSPFVLQTAYDYGLELKIVDYYYQKKKDNKLSTTEFYERLEQEIKDRNKNDFN